MRPLSRRAADDDPELREALDTFVLTGAVKLYREQRRQVGTLPAPHDARPRVGQATADPPRDGRRDPRPLAHVAATTAPAALTRLRSTLRERLRRSCEPSPDGEPVPATFDELQARTSARSCAQDRGLDERSRARRQQRQGACSNEEVDFDQRPVWRILVGGNQARPWLHRRRADRLVLPPRHQTQADTLMQMGRWFGFRAGYHDLVRLYIHRGPRRPLRRRSRPLPLRGALPRRAQRYAKVEDGSASVTPGRRSRRSSPSTCAGSSPRPPTRCTTPDLSSAVRPATASNRLATPSRRRHQRQHQDAAAADPAVRPPTDVRLPYTNGTGSYPAAYGTIDHPASSRCSSSCDGCPTTISRPT